MTHSIYNHDLDTQLDIDETLCENTAIRITDLEDDSSHIFYMNPKQLNNLIGTLLHVQAKKRKEYNTKF